MARILHNATQRNNTLLDTLINAASVPPTLYPIPCGGHYLPSARDFCISFAQNP